MKIHSGLYKNHKISHVNAKSTKETSAMVREAVFSMLGPIEGTALDLFAGSGSYGLTALSLGASSVYFVDSNYKAYQTVKKNVEKLNAGMNTIILKDDYKKFLLSNTVKFDFIFLDPPFDFDDYNELLNLVNPHLNNKGVIIVESEYRTHLNIEVLQLTQNKMKKYGTKKINIFIKQI